MNKIKEKILNKIEEMQIIDSHEHLGPEKEALKIKRDIFSLFYSYSFRDLEQAGMSKDQTKFIFNHEVPLELRWKVFSPFWKDIRYTSYSRNILYSLKKFYGFNDLNQNNYKDISIAIEENSQPGLYKRILREASNIKVAITQCCRTDVDDNKKDPLLIPIMPLWLGCGLVMLPEVEIKSKTVSWEDFQYSLNPWSYCSGDWKYKSTDIKNLDDCLENQERYLKKIKSEGTIGVKFSTYNTKINSNDQPNRKKAEQIFNDFKKGKIKELPPANDLHYYLLDEAISFAVKEGFVLSVHTGYWGDFRELSPLNVIPFIIRNPDGKFDLYHLGYPWIRESIMLGKGFHNVYINLCWIHIISQNAAKEALSEIIETIPVNKVIGFGGDYNYESVENIYGHLMMAKDNIAEVISNSIQKGIMDFDSGIEIIKKYFFYNIKNLYNLNFED